MHVVFVTPEYPSEKPEGGLATYVRKTAMELAKRGIDVSVIFPSSRDSFWNDGHLLIIEVRVSNYLYVRAIFRHLFYPGRVFSNQILPVLAQLQCLQRMRKAFHRLHSQKPVDLIHSANLYAIGFLLRKEEIPLVCRVSGYGPIWRGLLGYSRNLHIQIQELLEMKLIRESVAAFAPSQAIARVFRNMECITLEVIRTAATTDHGETDPVFFDSHIACLTPYLLYFGQINPYKGADLLIDVLPLFFQEFADFNFIMIGNKFGPLPGHDCTVLEAIQKSCRNWKHRFYHFDPIPHPQLYPVIANSKGVIMPSRLDNYPNACIEAQTFGVPVVGTSDSSLDEMIVDGETGFLCRNDDAEDLFRCIRRLLSQSKTEQETMKRKILEHVEELRASDPIRDLINFYNRAIKAKHQQVN